MWHPMGCIFCRSERNLTDEHVFPAFMGGKLVVRNGTCKICNGIFGVVEAAIKDATIPLLNLLKIGNRRGKIPNAPLKIEIRGMDMKNLLGFMDGAGNIQLCDYVKDVVDDDGRKRRQGFFVTQKAGDRFAERGSARGDKLIKREVPKEIIVEAEYTQGIMFSFTLDARKVVAKVALAAIAFEYGVPFALSPQFDELRAIGTQNYTQKLPVRIFANPNIIGAWLHTPYQHSVLCHLDAGMKKGWALVTLFGGLSYIVEVAPTYAEPRNRQFSLFYNAKSRRREKHIILMDEKTLIGHVLSPATSFENPDTVDAQWFPIIEGFCSDKGTIIARIKEQQNPPNA
jgi:hypothetical protein